MSQETNEPSELPETDAMIAASGAVDLQYATRSPPPPVVNAPAGRLDWAAIGIRLVALWSFFEVIPGIFLLPFLFTDDRDFTFKYKFLTLLPYIAYAIAGVVLWLTATSLARWMVSDVPPIATSAAEISSSPASRVEAQAMAFSVAGVVLTALALRLLPQVVRAVMRNGEFDERRSSSADHSLLVQFALELAIGIALFFGARGLANLWHRVRRDEHVAAEEPRNEH